MSESRTIKVLLVDDHHVVREGLRRILEMDDAIDVIGEARSGEEAVAKAVALSPDVIVMDLKMPGMDGIAATREIKGKLPDVNVLVLTLYAEDFVKQAMEAGVAGYLLKDSDSEQITRGVHQVYEGLSPIAPSLTRGLVTEFAKLSRSSRSSVLTPRQVDILKLIAEGESGKSIGEHLFLSTSTVKREVRHIFDKLGVNDRAHAVSEAMKRGLL
ncbi:MAG: response regulator transcription factor [Dehalococcoidia bacterium]|nr:response regulator transcription factor [Dehalococcoidia bacterium]MBL7165079.1 response regulator transcription factor [Dehalococcoidales bacterium]